MKLTTQTPPNQTAWNKGKLVGQKTPLKPDRRLECALQCVRNGVCLGFDDVAS